VIQVAAVLLVQDGEYVVQKRDDIPTIAEPGKTALWGGATEEEESWDMAASRELKEETGVEAPPEAFMLLTDFIVEGRSPRNKGKPVHVYLTALEVEKDVAVQCLEGVRLVRITMAEDATIYSDFLMEAIKLYEAKTRQDPF
jgi:8-oxo-dGTP pyrophosphatase MutT (NUDIX family)